MANLYTYRDTVLNNLPRWMKGYYGDRLNYAFSLLTDAMGELLVDGMAGKYPMKNHDDVYDNFVLSLCGAEHGIIRGLNESSSSYAERLKYWRNARRRKGNGFVLMEQIQALLSPYPVRMRIITDNGNRYTLKEGGYKYSSLYTSLKYSDYSQVPVGTVEIDDVDWYWRNGDNPNRFWVMIYDTSGTLYTRDGFWNSYGYFGDGQDSIRGWNTSTDQKVPPILDPLSHDYTGTYGSTFSHDTAQVILSLIREWAPPHSQPDNLILAFTESGFNNIQYVCNSEWDNPGNRSLEYVYWKI